MADLVQLVNIGTQVNDGLGDPLRTAFDKINQTEVALCDAINLNTDLIVVNQGGTSLFVGKSGTELQFKGLLAVAESAVEIHDYGTALGIGLTTSGLSVTTASNIGGGAGIFSTKVGMDLRLKSLLPGDNIQFTQTGSNIRLDVSGHTDGVNLGGGQPIFAQKAGTDLEFKTITAGSNVTLNATGSTLSVEVSDHLTTSNIGGGAGVFAQTVNGNTELKSFLITGAGLVINTTGSTVQIENTSDDPATLTTSTPSGEELTLPRNGQDFPFKGLTAGPNITLNATGSTVGIESSAITVVAGQNIATVNTNGTTTVSVDTISTTTVEWTGPLVGDVGSLGYSGTVAIDFSAATPAFQTINLTGDIHLVPVNMAEGRSVCYRLFSDSVIRNVGVTAEVDMVGTFPGVILADKVAITSFTSFGSTTADIVGAYAYKL